VIFYENMCLYAGKSSFGVVQVPTVPRQSRLFFAISDQNYGGAAFPLIPCDMLCLLAC
jgi:hypothetical protein